MTQQPLFSPSRLAISPRPFQAEAVENSFRLWDSGVVGTMMRIYTGGGKTITTCMQFDRWLRRGPNYRCMVLSYEKQLVWQFAEEIEDVLGITPGIEMEAEKCDEQHIPQIVVASRQSLAEHRLASLEQLAYLAEKGLNVDGKLITFVRAKRYIRLIKAGETFGIQDEIDEHNRHYTHNQDVGAVSRLYKFDWQHNWLIACDEAHKFALKLRTVGHLKQWFDQNPLTRWSGCTATPKRSDGVSGKSMFPGIAIDYPLVKAIEDGYAVKYVQKYILVEGVDFKSLNDLKKGADFDDAQLERLLGDEGQIAKLVKPMLDHAGDRKTLIFSPGVEMARKVAAFINARRRCQCTCGTIAWHERVLLGDGASCNECGRMVEQDDVLDNREQSRALWGEIPPNARRETYTAHQAGDFQFLSVCGLCKEGYNDPDISCVVIFRPVSKAASSLAEQMKGRGGRVARNVINGLLTAEERLAAIAASSKPNCLIIDLVGVTGLADCASTVSIYAEGEEDEVAERAEQLVEGGVDDVLEAISKAKEEIKEERERARLAREEERKREIAEAEARSRARADVEYSTHDVGSASNYDPSRPTDKMLKAIRYHGIEFTGWEPSRAQASRMIGQLKDGLSCEDVVYQNGIDKNNWQPSKGSVAQVRYANRLGIRGATTMTPKELHAALDARLGKAPEPKASSTYDTAIASCQTHAELTDVGVQLAADRKAGAIDDATFKRLVELGRKKREDVF